jgi:cell shape-determining protein MreD
MNWLNSMLILLAAFLTIFVEAVFDIPRNILGAQIDLLPSLMVYAALSSNLTTVCLLAVLGGLGFDTLSMNPLGVTIMPLFLVGYAITLKCELILGAQVFAQMAIGFFACAIVPATTLLLISCTKLTPLLGWETLWQWFVLSVGGGLITPVFFKLFGRLNSSLNYRPVHETTFRMDREIRRGRN